MKSILLIIIGLSCSLLSAQKRVDKIIDAQNISTLYIDGANCFNIQIVASTSSQIKIQTKMEGEHSEEMLVVTRTQQDSLYIGTRFQPLFEADNDKLSAHKVMSIELEIQIPENLNLVVISDIASVEVEGVFTSAFIELNQGQCKLLSFLGSATVNTINGAIYVETNYATVHATSRHGAVALQNLIPGENQLHLKSIQGSISVIKTE
ncbi:hypothetical protein [Formosa algae]|uniref:hypothetical protein n=1 Tax=Formosa algae TaxID=225843 RepID=UPI000CD2B2F8|nr:hypothetical protein [Formosa algae]